MRVKKVAGGNPVVWFSIPQISNKSYNPAFIFSKERPSLGKCIAGQAGNLLVIVFRQI